MPAPTLTDFVLANTTLTPVPLVPEVVLHSAAEAMDLWELTDHDQPPFWAFPWAGGQALARYLLDHLPPIGKPDRTALKVYKGGHMFYFDPAIRAAFTADAQAFYRRAGM